jgi:hypothetical protein
MVFQTRLTSAENYVHFVVTWAREALSGAWNTYIQAEILITDSAYWKRKICSVLKSMYFKYKLQCDYE